ncbi:hypothetical protein COCSUDRAFT_83673 [Coccomyxa subellipsoidea C-169]|uniref:Uncharacterized protein n=1 Tax=Coccomyxa subellipsoidea (strain C-169) TaxID=574566 RepID=I0Z150_COCSC|nr:hypothetical protein COCSUDRAFT_83673 [Coccomyxa subellipsoidea C-169]EIE24369.1 hypothetical protein COCSUDRAFT_83673 [Coccomyxa subellipsoidea C-169]|eukprot:XP_005648913.1 hypothetical protein COCSUDRAFT_83673 [Coccomyxa subellipsoidea C-169]
MQNGATALRAATVLGDGEAVQVLLGGGADPNQETSRGTPLSAAAHEGDVSMLTLFLDAGAEVNHGQLR